MRSNAIHLGDSFAILPTLQAESFDSVVTDPPYGIRFMGQAWDGKDIVDRTKNRTLYRTCADADPRAGANGAHNSIAAEAGKYNLSVDANRQFQEWTRAWAVEAFRLLKPGAHLVCFASTRTYHRMASGIEDAGFEIRDQLAWTFGSGFPKSSNQSGEWEGYGTALKPAWEPIVLARKPLVGTVPENLAAHGVGALNIDACRIPFAGEADERETKGKNQHTAFESGPTDNKVFGKFDKPREDYDASGRWPANLMHDGSEEVCGLFPDAKGAGHAPAFDGGAGRLFKASNGTGGLGVRDDMEERHFEIGSTARFFYCGKATVEDREAGLSFAKLGALAYGNQAQAEVKRGNIEHTGESGMNTVKLRANTHPTVKPTDLMRWLCRLVTPPGGRILDPFFGSGSTGRGAVLEGFTFTGIEREAEYGEIARARVVEAAGEMFSNVEVIDGKGAND